MTTSNISPSMAYEINLNYRWILKSGIQFSYSTSNFNSNNLVFFDQLGQDGIILERRRVTKELCYLIG